MFLRRLSSVTLGSPASEEPGDAGEVAEGGGAAFDVNVAEDVPALTFVFICGKEAYPPLC